MCELEPLKQLRRLPCGCNLLSSFVQSQCKLLMPGNYADESFGCGFVLDVPEVGRLVRLSADFSMVHLRS